MRVQLSHFLRAHSILPFDRVVSNCSVRVDSWVTAAIGLLEDKINDKKLWISIFCFDEKHKSD